MLLFVAYMIQVPYQQDTWDLKSSANCVILRKPKERRRQFFTLNPKFVYTASYQILFFFLFEKKPTHLKTIAQFLLRQQWRYVDKHVHKHNQRFPKRYPVFNTSRFSDFVECLPRHKLHICHFPSRSFRFNGCSQRLIAPSSLQRPTETPPSTFNDPNQQFGVRRLFNRRFGRPNLFVFLLSSL